MIVDYVAIKLNSPDSLFANPTYPSGLNPEQNPIYTYGYPKNSNPTIILPENLYDNSGNFIPNGFYNIALSNDKKFLLLIQSSELKAKIPVTSYTKIEPTEEELSQEAEIKERMEKARLSNNLKKYKAAEYDLKSFNTRRESKMSAEIFDSGRGYYIIQYWRQLEKVTGAIAK